MEKELNASWGPSGSDTTTQRNKDYRRLRRELKQYDLYRKTLENTKLKCKVWTLQDDNLKLLKENLALSSRKGAKTQCFLELEEQVASLQDTCSQQGQTLQELTRQFNKNKDNSRADKLKKLFTFSNGEQESCSEIDIFDPEVCIQADPQLLGHISQIEHRLKQLNNKLSK